MSRQKYATTAASVPRWSGNVERLIEAQSVQPAFGASVERQRHEDENGPRTEIGRSSGRSTCTIPEDERHPCPLVDGAAGSSPLRGGVGTAARASATPATPKTTERRTGASYAARRANRAAEEAAASCANPVGAALRPLRAVSHRFPARASTGASEVEAQLAGSTRKRTVSGSSGRKRHRLGEFFGPARAVRIARDAPASPEHRSGSSRLRLVGRVLPLHSGWAALAIEVSGGAAFVVSLVAAAAIFLFVRLRGRTRSSPRRPLGGRSGLGVGGPTLSLRCGDEAVMRSLVRSPARDASSAGSAFERDSAAAG